MAKLIDKVLDAAKAYLKEQEGVPATVDGWRIIRAYDHTILISVEISTRFYHSFDIWVTVDLDTEEIVVQE